MKPEFNVHEKIIYREVKQSPSNPNYCSYSANSGDSCVGNIVCRRTKNSVRITQFSIDYRQMRMGVQNKLKELCGVNDYGVVIFDEDPNSIFAETEFEYGVPKSEAF